MRAIARLGLRGLLLGLDLLMQLRELERNISKQIKFQFENRNLNTQVLLKFIKMNFAGPTKKFSFFSFEDIADFHFQHEFCRSRMYEYPFALQEIANLYIESPVIHNASWGFQDINLVFKTWLDIKYPNTFHSDIKKSTLFQTFLWDITSFPQESMHDRFDVILNISTLEECNADHSIVLKNHLIQLKKRGRLIITFAHPGLQLDSIGKFIDSKIVTPQLKLNPRNPRQEDRKLGLPDEFSVGCLVIDRIK